MSLTRRVSLTRRGDRDLEAAAYEEMERLQGDHWWFKARRKILESQISSLFDGAGLKVLEVGCGPGGNLEMLSKFGAVSALEMDDEARIMAKRKFPNARIEYGCLPDVDPFEGETFDLIAMLDVAEHIPDDVGALAKLSERLNPGGYLLLTVPAYQWMWSVHDERLHHQRRYTRGRLSDVLNSSGWLPEKLVYFNSLLFPLAATARLFDKFSKAETPSGMDLPNPFVNSVFYSLFSSERHWLKQSGFPFGVSLLAIAQPAKSNQR